MELISLIRPGRKLLASYPHANVYDYDAEMRSFVLFIKREKLDIKHDCEICVFKDDGTYEAPSGKYVVFHKDRIYCTLIDLYNAWKEK